MKLLADKEGVESELEEQKKKCEQYDQQKKELELKLAENKKILDKKNKKLEEHKKMLDEYEMEKKELAYRLWEQKNRLEHQLWEQKNRLEQELTSK